MDANPTTIERSHVPDSRRSDVDWLIERYVAEADKTARRRVKSRCEAPKRRIGRQRAVEAAFANVAAMPAGQERVLAGEHLERKLAASARVARQAADERDLVRRRMKHGFESTRTVLIGDRHRAPFVQKRLKSDHLGKAGKLFVRACRKARFLRSANEKGFICVQTGRKVLNLDYAWVEGNRTMVSLIRIDLDYAFDSFTDLRVRLGTMVAEGRLPCMPHLVVGDVCDMLDEDEEGRAVIRQKLWKPHLWFILPDAVNMGPKGRAAPRRLLDAVYRGLCNVLLPLGADPNAKALLVRGKNPLSPWWETENFNDEFFPNLSEYAAVLGDAMKLSQEQLARLAAEEQSGLPATVSNVAFNTWKAETWRLLREWHGKRDPAYLAALSDRKALKELLAAAMPLDYMLTLGEGLTEPTRSAYVLDKVLGFAARQWSPQKADEAAGYRSRGRLRHLTDDAPTLKAKQAIAGKVVAEARMQAAQHAVIQAMSAVETSGAPFTQAEVTRASGLNRKTVSRHWRFCLSRRPQRCLDKKERITTVQSKTSQQRGRSGSYARAKWGHARSCRGRSIVSVDSMTVHPVHAIRQPEADKPVLVVRTVMHPPPFLSKTWKAPEGHVRAMDGADTTQPLMADGGIVACCAGMQHHAVSARSEGRQGKRDEQGDDTRGRAAALPGGTAPAAGAGGRPG